MNPETRAWLGSTDVRWSCGYKAVTAAWTERVDDVEAELAREVVGALAAGPDGEGLVRRVVEALRTRDDEAAAAADAVHGRDDDPDEAARGRPGVDPQASAGGSGRRSTRMS